MEWRLNHVGQMAQSVQDYSVTFLTMEASHLKMKDQYLPYVLESLSANVQNIHMVSDRLLWLFLQYCR